MSRSAKSLMAPILGIAGVALLWVWAPAAVAVSFVAVILGVGGFMGVNKPSTRIAYFGAVLAHAAVIWLGSRSPALVATVLVALLPTAPTEPLVRRFGYAGGWIFVPVAILSVGLFALAWPSGVWRWAAAPSVTFVLFMTMGMVKGLKELRAQRRPSWKVKIGQPFPEFSLSTRSGQTFDLAAERGRWVLLCLLRGDWCPICHVQMRIYQKEAPVLAKHNVKLVLVGTGAGPEAQTFAREMGVETLLLEDRENLVATGLGAVQHKLYKGNDGPLPVSFLIDPEGKVRHASRPDDLESFLDPRKVIDLLRDPKLVMVPA